MDFEALSEFLNSVSLPVLALAGAMAIIIGSLRIVPVIVKFFTDMQNRQQADDERQQKVWEHLMDTSIQLAKTQQNEFERQLKVQQGEFERQLGIQKDDFERELGQEREAREKLASELGSKLLKKDREIAGLENNIATLTADLQDALRDLGASNELITNLTSDNARLEKKVTELLKVERQLEKVIKERNELREIVGELSDRLALVEDVQRKGDTNPLDAAKAEKADKEAKEKAA